MQAITIAAWHNKDCYTTVSQFYHVQKIFKLNTGPREFINGHSAGMSLRTSQLNLGKLRLHFVTSVTMDVLNISNSRKESESTLEV